MDRDVIEGKGCKNKQSSFKNMTELMCVCMCGLQKW